MLWPIVALLVAVASFCAGDPLNRGDAYCYDSDGTTLLGPCSRLVENCTITKICQSGELHLIPTKCPHNAHCGTVGGAMNCVCNEGYEFDMYQTYCRKIEFKPPTDGSCIDWKVDEKRYPSDYRKIEGNCTKLVYCSSDAYLVRRSFDCGETSKCAISATGEETCVCKEGFVLDRSQCVKKGALSQRNGCYSAELGKTMKHGETQLTDDCTKQHLCWNGKYDVLPLNCARKNGGCAWRDGYMTCYCDEGYEHNGSRSKCLFGFE